MFRLQPAEQYDKCILLIYNGYAAYSLQKILDVLIDEFKMNLNEALEHFQTHIEPLIHQGFNYIDDLN